MNHLLNIYTNSLVVIHVYHTQETSKAAHDEAVIDEKRNEEEEKEDYLTGG